MRYLLVTYVRKGNGQIDEQVGVSKKVKPNDIQTCNVIMDFKEKTVEKSVLQGQVINKNWDDMYNYYKQFYPSVIQRLEAEAAQE